MRARLKDIFVGNWKNKLVALFFACTIWYVAYQSEFRVQYETVQARLVPEHDDQIIVSKSMRRPNGERSEFRGDLRIRVNASRKQIEELESSLPRQLEIPVGGVVDELTQKTHEFTEEDLAAVLPFSLTTIDDFSPSAVELVIDRLGERTVPVVPLYSLPSRYETEIARLDPSEVTIEGPVSLLEEVRVVADIPLAPQAKEFQGSVPLRVELETDEGLRPEELFTFQSRRAVDALVRLRLKEDELKVDSARVRFLVPPVKFPFEIRFDEQTIPVVFRGPEHEIARLTEEVAKPDFHVVVPVLEAGLSPQSDFDFTFTEQDLLLIGFSKDVQKLQHPTREMQGLGAWRCTISPVKPQEK